MSSRSMTPIRCGGLTAIIERPTQIRSERGSRASMPGVSNSALPRSSPSGVSLITAPSPISET